MSDSPFDFNWSEITKHHERQRNEYARLRGGGIVKDVIVGDRVIVAVGLLGRGFTWIRTECKVLEVNDTSCLVRHTDKDYKHNNWEEWIDRYLITDVLERSKENADN